MLKSLQKTKDSKSQSGFTIIEVLIVLAIAGLILLIVFLAVPALQRSSRNTQRKNDASAVGGAIANYISNNAGTVPTVVGKNASASILEVCGAGGAGVGGNTPCTGNIEQAKLGYYVDANIFISKAAATPAAPAPAAAGAAGTATTVSTNSVAIIYGQDCTPSASARTAAIYYATETGGSTGSVQCIEQ